MGAKGTESDLSEHRVRRLVRMYNSAGDAAAEIPGDIRSDSIARAARRYGLEFRQKFSFTTEYTMRDSR